MKPLVSVIIPNYNRELYIKECIQSVYNQSYRPIELIVVDDGSTDKSISIIKECQVTMDNGRDFILNIYCQKNRGASIARNRGFKESNGDYIQWLDSDDILLYNKIELQLGFFNEGTDVVYSKAQFFQYERKNLINRFWGRPPAGNSSDYFEFPWQTMCALYKTSSILKYGLWAENLSLSDDWEFSVRYKIKANVFFLDEVLALYRHHDGHRIGNYFTIEKIESLTNVLLQSFITTKESGLLDKVLVKRYQKRLMFCFIQLGSFGDKKGRKNLIRKIRLHQLDNTYFFFLNKISNRRVNKYILKLFELLK